MAKSRVKIGTGVLVCVAVCAAAGFAFKNGLIPTGHATAGPPGATPTDPSPDAFSDAHSGDSHVNDDPFADPAVNQHDAAPADPSGDTVSAHDGHHHHAHHEDSGSDADWQSADDHGIHKVSGTKPADRETSGPEMHIPSSDNSPFKDLPDSK
jgi:hypothetical protein